MQSSGNWVVDNIVNALNTWNEKMAEIWQLVSQSPQSFKGGSVWNVIEGIHNSLVAVGLPCRRRFAGSTEPPLERTRACQGEGQQPQEGTGRDQSQHTG